MNKIKDPILFQGIKKFLTTDMPIVRKKSVHTIEAYRYTLNLFLYRHIMEVREEHKIQ